MAIVARKSPYIMDAVGDDLASVFQGRDMLDTTPVVSLKVASIRVIAAGSGQCVLTDGPGGQEIYVSKMLNPGEEAKFEPAAPIWFDDIYVADLPAANAGVPSEVHIYIV